MVNMESLMNGYGLVCDCIQDPGNLGTIIRIADWFGISQIICSEDTADVYNPKVIQSSMASIGRVNIIYKDLNPWIAGMAKNLPIMVSTMSGNDVYQAELPNHGLLVLGNEAKGVSEDIIKAASFNIHIPGLGKAESLNVAIAAGILCAELNRKK